MITEELIKYIKTQTEKNIPQNIIISKLTEAGWSSENIKEALTKAFESSAEKNPAPIKKTLDPYRELLHENFESNKPKISESKEEKMKEEFLPTLKPKEIKQEFEAIVSGSNFKREVLKNESNQESLIEISPKTINKTKKILFPIIILIVLAILVGGSFYAYKKGFINLNNFNIPFLKNNPEKDLRKIINAILNTKSAHFEKLLIFSTSDENNQLPLSFYIKTSGDFDLREKGLPSISENIFIKSNTGSRIDLNYESNIKFIGKKIYIRFPQVVSFLEKDFMNPETWVSVSYNDIEKLKLENNLTSKEEVKEDDNLKEVINYYLKTNNIVENEQFIGDLKFIGKEKIGEIKSKHYQFSISNIFIKKLVRDILESESNEQGNNLNEAIKILNSMGDIKTDLWVNKKTYEPIKVHLSAFSKFNEFQSSSLEISIDFSNINQPVLILTPEKTISSYDVVKSFINQSELLKKDLGLKNEVDNLLLVIENYKNTNKNYGIKLNSSGNCKNSIFNSYKIATQLKVILKITENKGLCYSDSEGWAFSFPIFSDNTKYYCVDSKGYMNQIDFLIKKNSCQ